MGRAKKFFEGLIFFFFLVVGDGPMSGKNRTVICKCLACGAVKTVRVDSIQNGRAADCTCKKRVPLTLPQNKGIACKSRLKSCIKSAGGYCCYYCPSKRTCDDACLNKPDKCGSFYINRPEIKHEQNPEDEPQQGLIKYRREV